MEVAQAIANAREKAESLTRLARILARIKPLIYATGTTIRLHHDGEDLDFHCMTEADAGRLAAALPGKLELAYQGASTTLTATIHIQGVDFNFFVPTIRKIRLEQCEVKRKRRPSSCGWNEAKLLFHGLELVKISYPVGEVVKNLKERLWNAAIKAKKGKERLEKFDLVL